MVVLPLVVATNVGLIVVVCSDGCIYVGPAE